MKRVTIEELVKMRSVRCQVTTDEINKFIDSAVHKCISFDQDSVFLYIMTDGGVFTGSCERYFKSSNLAQVELVDK